MTPALNPMRPRLDKSTGVFALKWAASIIQILGYTATAFGMTPLNIYLFLAGLVGWFLVGFFWRDRAIMLIHVVALAAMVIGLPVPDRWPACLAPSAQCSGG